MLESTGVNPMLLALQIFNMILMVGWLVLLSTALMRLYRTNLPDNQRSMWLVILFLMPFIGSILFLVIHGRDQRKRKSNPNPYEI